MLIAQETGSRLPASIRRRSALARLDPAASLR